MSRKLVAVVVLGAMTYVAGPGALAAPRASGPKTVLTDAAGDAGVGDTPGDLPVVDEGGFDIVKGTIVKKGKNLEFTVTHSAMPPIGSLPEAFRFLWHFNSGRNEYRFMAKNVDVGKPDVIAMSGQDRVGKVDPDGHFRLEQCVNEPSPAVVVFVNCRPTAYLEGKFDPAAKSFTVVVPLTAIKAKKGTKITSGTAGNASLGCIVCWINHTAERSNSGGATGGGTLDQAAISATYVVPK